MYIVGLFHFGGLRLPSCLPRYVVDGFPFGFHVISFLLFYCLPSRYSSFVFYLFFYFLAVFPSLIHSRHFTLPGWILWHRLSRLIVSSLLLLFKLSAQSNIIMPRKEFLRDLADAAVPGRYSCISDIRTGDYDGSISFTFAAPAAGLILDLQAIVSGNKYP